MSEYLPLTIHLPCFPPPELAKNRMPAHPIVYRRIFKRTRNDMSLLICNRLQHIGDPPRLTCPLFLDIVWQQIGPHQNRPDSDAVIARAGSPAMDAAQLSGLVANDRQISIGVVMIEQAGSKDSQGVSLTFRVAPTREVA